MDKRGEQGSTGGDRVTQQTPGSRGRERTGEDGGEEQEERRVGNGPGGAESGTGGRGGKRGWSTERNAIKEENMHLRETIDVLNTIIDLQDMKSNGNTTMHQ